MNNKQIEQFRVEESSAPASESSSSASEDDTMNLDFLNQGSQFSYFNY